METLNTKKVLKNYVHPDIFLERWEADDMTPMSQKEKDAFYNTSQKCYPIAFNNWLYKVPIDDNAKDYNNYIVVEYDEEGYDDDENELDDYGTY